jgi:hypothetical protein
MQRDGVVRRAAARIRRVPARSFMPGWRDLAASQPDGQAISGPLGRAVPVVSASVTGEKTGRGDGGAERSEMVDDCPGARASRLGDSERFATPDRECGHVEGPSQPGSGRLRTGASTRPARRGRLGTGQLCRGAARPSSCRQPRLLDRRVELPELAADHARRRPYTALEAGGAPRLTQAPRPRRLLVDHPRRFPIGVCPRCYRFQNLRSGVAPLSDAWQAGTSRRKSCHGIGRELCRRHLSPRRSEKRTIHYAYKVGNRELASSRKDAS